MNKWFNKIEYAQNLVEGNPKSYSGADIMMMAGFLIHIKGLSCKEANKIIYDTVSPLYDTLSLGKRAKAWTNIVKRAEKKAFFNIPEIQIYRTEINKICTADSITKRRVLFTLLCFAKYLNLGNPLNNNWVSFTDSMIKKSAGIWNMTQSEFNHVLYVLKEEGFITHSKKITSNNIHVEFVEESGESVISLSDLRGLGDIYVAKWDYPGGEGERRLKTCKGCGTPFLDRTKKNNRFYCRNCKTFS